MYHIITGNGKGKTTAALGMAVRASGAGLKVFIGQFVKGKAYAEHSVLQSIPKISLKLFGRTCFIEKDPEKEDFEAAKNGLREIEQIFEESKYQLVILDEIHIALYYKLIDLQYVIELIKKHKSSCEIVSTGRYAPDELIELADLVSDIKEVKHYYSNGVEARKGIEY
jgi:cob(I)alamin adenosyltransferase